MSKKCYCGGKIIEYYIYNATTYVFNKPVKIPKEKKIICTNLNCEYNDEDLDSIYRLYEEQYNILCNNDVSKALQKSNMSLIDFSVAYDVSKYVLQISGGTISKESSDMIRKDFGDIL